MLKKLRRLIFTGLFVVCWTSAFAQEGENRWAYPPEIDESAQVEVYKKIGDVELKMWVFNPEEHDVNEKRPAAVFFFGGGWWRGSPKQFEEHAKYLAGRGMIAMLADYRVASRHKTRATACVEDAKSAIRWVRQNAGRLGVDTKRVAAVGESAGGHIAASAALISDYDAESEDKTISSVPDAMVLFNAPCVLSSIEGVFPAPENLLQRLERAMGTDPANVSPYHFIKSDAPPTIIFHGTADSRVPFMTIKLFADKMKEAGNRCELVAYEDMPHAFALYGRNDNKPYAETLYKTDEFFTSLGYLEGRPTIKVD